MYLEREEEGVLSTPLEGLGEGCTTGYTRKLLSKAREELEAGGFSAGSGAAAQSASPRN